MVVGYFLHLSGYFWSYCYRFYVVLQLLLLLLSQNLMESGGGFVSEIFNRCAWHWIGRFRRFQCEPRKKFNDSFKGAFKQTFWNGSHAIPMQRGLVFTKIIIPSKCKLGLIFANFLIHQG